MLLLASLSVVVVHVSCWAESPVAALAPEATDVRRAAKAADATDADVMRARATPVAFADVVARRPSTAVGDEAKRLPLA